MPEKNGDDLAVSVQELRPRLSLFNDLGHKNVEHFHVSLRHYLTMHPFNRHRVTEVVEVRPRFRMTTSATEEEVLDMARTHLNTHDDVSGKVFWHHAIFRVPDDQKHYWSPELQFSVEKDPLSGETLVRCLIGPRQSVWAFFLFLYALPGLLMFFFGMNAFVQYSLHDDLSTMWVIPVCLAFIALVYLAAFFGRKKGHEQMLHLIRFAYGIMEPLGYERQHV